MLIALAEGVRDACVAMAAGWLESVGGFIPRLLQQLDVENETQVCADLVAQLLKKGMPGTDEVEKGRETDNNLGTCVI